jgi:hypothetical protein
VKKKTAGDPHAQALHALNCAIACMVSWPPSDEKLGGAVYFTSLALYRMAQADPDGDAATWAELYLERATQSESGVVSIAPKETP